MSLKGNHWIRLGDWCKAQGSLSLSFYFNLFPYFWLCWVFAAVGLFSSCGRRGPLFPRSATECIAPAVAGGSLSPSHQGHPPPALFKNIFIYFFIWLCWVFVAAHRIFDLQRCRWDLYLQQVGSSSLPGIKLRLPALGVQGLSNRTSREVPRHNVLLEISWYQNQK